MKAKEKRAQKAIQKDKRFRVINLEEEEETPLSIKIDNNLYLLLCRPHQFYKVRGIEKMLFKGSECKIDGVQNHSGQNLQNGQCILEVSQTHKEKDELLEELLWAHKESKSLNADQIKQSQMYFTTSIPLLIVSKDLSIELTFPPWPERVLEVLTKVKKFPNKSRVFISGNKNTGKSELSNYFINEITKKQPVCLLQLDVGKGRGLPGSISLYRYTSPTKYETITYWIGEYTPLNYCTIYLASVKKLVQIHRSQYFNDPLIVNTMGYLTGFGELVLLEIYNIIEPSDFIFLSKNNQRTQYQGLRKSLQSLDYTLRRKILGIQEESKVFYPDFSFVINTHAGIKQSSLKSSSFKQSLGINTFEQLLSLKLPQFKFSQIVIQTTDGKLLNKQFDPIYTDLQLLIFCNKEDGDTFRLKGIGYGFNGKIFGQAKGSVCIKSQIAQFEKQFYDLNEKALISLEQTLEFEVPYLLPNYKGLGTMGYRNLASKKLRT